MPPLNLIIILLHFWQPILPGGLLTRTGLFMIKEEDWLLSITGRVALTDMVNLPDLRLTEEEKHYQRLWQSFINI